MKILGVGSTLVSTILRRASLEHHQYNLNWCYVMKTKEFNRGDIIFDGGLSLSLQLELPILTELVQRGVVAFRCLFSVGVVVYFVDLCLSKTSCQH